MFKRYAPLAASTLLAVTAFLRFAGQAEAADAIDAAYVAVGAAAATLYGVARKVKAIYDEAFGK
jgi:hypothetical protein